MMLTSSYADYFVLFSSLYYSDFLFYLFVCTEFSLLCTIFSLW